MCTHARVHTHTHTHTYTRAHTHTHTHIHTRARAHTHTHTRTRTHIHKSSLLKKCHHRGRFALPAKTASAVAAAAAAATAASFSAGSVGPVLGMGPGDAEHFTAPVSFTPPASFTPPLGFVCAAGATSGPGPQPAAVSRARCLSERLSFSLPFGGREGGAGEVPCLCLPGPAAGLGDRDLPPRDRHHDRDRDPARDPDRLRDRDRDGDRGGSGWADGDRKRGDLEADRGNALRPEGIVPPTPTLLVVCCVCVCLLSSLFSSILIFSLSLVRALPFTFPLSGYWLARVQVCMQACTGARRCAPLSHAHTLSHTHAHSHSLYLSLSLIITHTHTDTQRFS